MPATFPTLHRWITRRHPPAHRVGDRLVVADRRQPVRDPARVDGRHAGVPVGRQGHRRRRRVQPPQVGPGDRAGPLRRQRTARPQRLELRQPLLRRRRAGGADDERRRPPQGGTPRRRLLRLLLPAAASGQDADRRARRDRPRAPGRAGGSGGAASSRGSTAAGATPCCGRSRPWSAATSRCRASSTTCARAGQRSTSTCSATTRSPTTPDPSVPTRSPCSATSTARSIASQRTTRWAPRPYRIVVLSDHGQTQGATFVRAHRRDAGRRSSAASAVRRRRATPTPRPAAPSRRPGCARPATRTRRAPRSSADTPIVLASGALGLVSIPGQPRRLTREEIDARYPRLIDGLVGHPEIGFVLVRTAAGHSVVLGPTAATTWRPAAVTGVDPLEPFGPAAVDQVREVDAYRTAADLMINSRYDPVLDEVAAFEHQVSSHGGARRAADPSVPPPPERPRRPRRSDLRVTGAAPGAQGLARRPRSARGRSRTPTPVTPIWASPVPPADPGVARSRFPRPRTTSSGCGGATARGRAAAGPSPLRCTRTPGRGSRTAAMVRPCARCAGRGSARALT